MKMDEIEKQFWECPDPPFPATSTPVITNYDLLISKTPEEMAEFLCHTVSPSGVINCSSCAASESCRMGHNGWLSWLKSPVEADDDH